MLTWLKQQHYFESVKQSRDKLSIAITREMSSRRVMSLDVDRRQAENGKTEHSTSKNSKEWMWRQETNDDRQSTDGMVERAVHVGVLMTSEICDGLAGQRHEPADSDMVERDHAVHERHNSHLKVDSTSKLRIPWRHTVDEAWVPLYSRGHTRHSLCRYATQLAVLDFGRSGIARAKSRTKFGDWWVGRRE